MDKRKSILTAALKLFSSTHDIKKVSIEDIALEAHVSPTSIYNHFDNRDKLVYEVIKELAQANIERNKAIVYSNIPFSQKIIGIISGKMAVADQVNQEIIEKMLSQDKKIAPFIDEIYEREIKPLWKAIMEDGKKQGYVNPSLDETAIVMYLDILEAGLKSKMEIFKDIKENMELLKQLTRIMFYGFLNKDIDLFSKEVGKTHDR